MTHYNSPGRPLSSQTLLLLCCCQWELQTPDRQRGSRRSAHHHPAQCLALRSLHSVRKRQKKGAVRERDVFAVIVRLAF